LALGDYQNVKCHACIGGTAVRKDLDILNDKVHIVVGTPGRVYDMISRGALNPDKMSMFILDEADEMLSRGFKDQIYDVFRKLPANIQVRLGVPFCIFIINGSIIFTVSKIIRYNQYSI